MIDIDRIRDDVANSAEPLHEACQVIGAMLDVIAALYGRDVVEQFIAKLNEDLPPQPNHAATEL